MRIEVLIHLNADYTFQQIKHCYIRCWLYTILVKFYKKIYSETKKLLIVEQLLLVNIIEYVLKTVSRIYILMSGCNKKLILKAIFTLIYRSFVTFSSALNGVKVW